MTETPYKRVLIGNKTNTKFTPIIDEKDYYKHLKILDEKGIFFEIVGLEQFKVKPYFDLDPKGDFNAKLYDEFEEDLKKIYDAPLAKMGRATREEEGIIKHSRRYYLLNCKITYHLIPIYFMHLFDKYGKKGLKILDDGIYNKNRKFYLPLSSKKIKEENKKVISFSVPKLELIEGTIFDNSATYIEEDYFDLDNDLLEKNKRKFEEIKQNEIKRKEEQIKQQQIKQQEEEEEEEDEDEDKNTDKYEKLKKIIERLSPQRADDYNDWLNVLFCIINISEREKITKRRMYELIHLFSKKSSKYDESEVDDKIDTNIDNNTNKKLGWNYLYNTCIKEDDKEYYNMINKNYKNVKKNFEEDHLKIIHPPMIIYTNREGENIKESFKDARCSYSHLSYNKKEEDKKGNIKYKKTKFINDWLDDDNIRICEKVCFKPPSYIRNYVNTIEYQEKPNTQSNNYEYNLWTHYEILKTPYYNDTDEDKEFNNKVLERLFDFMSNIYDNNNEVINYLLAYFANRLQRPYQRNKICIIVKGTEGDGKNTFFDIIKGIVGRKYYSEIETAKQIFGDHSTVEDCKMFVCLNEANPKDNYENSERLKSRITTDTILINPKNITPYDIDNRCDYLMTTNNENCVKVDEGSRRYILIKTSGHYKGNIDFFNDFYKNIIDNKRALRVIYEYLINYNVCSIVPSLNFQDERYIPKTEYQKQVINENKDRILLFLEDLTLKNKYIDKKKYTNQAFFAEWTEWVKTNNYKIDFNNISFGTRLMLLVKKHKIEKFITKDQNKNTIIDFKELFKYFNFIEEDDE